MEDLKWPEITKDTRLEEIKRIHQQIWDYVIECGEKPKTPYELDCVACEYDRIYNGRCFSCPILWPINEDGYKFCCGSTASALYNRWDHATGEEKTELARQIRDLPWKFEMEEKENV